MSNLPVLLALSLIAITLSQTTVAFYQDTNCESARNYRFYPFCSTSNTRLTYYSCTQTGFWEDYFIRENLYYKCAHGYPKLKTRSINLPYSIACLRDDATPGLSQIGKCGGTYTGALFESFKGKSCDPDYVQWNEIDVVNTCWPCYGTQCNRITNLAKSFTYECTGDKYQGKYYHESGCTGNFTLDLETYTKDRCYAFTDDTSWKFKGCNVAYTHNAGIVSTLSVLLFSVALFVGIY